MIRRALAGRLAAAGLLAAFVLWPASAMAQEPASVPPAEPEEPTAAEPAPAPPSVAPAPTAPTVAPAPMAGEDGAAAPSSNDESESADPQPDGSRSASEHGTSSWRPRVLSQTDWRRRARRGDRRESETFRFVDVEHFVAELRFGPYSPEVDEEFEGKALTDSEGNAVDTPPFEDYYGDKPFFYFGLELDWLPLYVPYVGSVGAGLGWGYTSRSGNTRLASDHDTEAASETTITIMPMHTSAVVRIDGPLREFGFPVVPYAKLGLGFGLWSVSGTDGTAEVDGVVAEGTSLGPHIALGGAVALNALDRSQAVSLREESGIRYAYAFGEWMYDNLDSDLHVGTSTAVFGLALDF